MSENCPICDESTGHLNNHMRMSAGDHGEQGTYPEAWDKSTSSFAEGGGDSPRDRPENRTDTESLLSETPGVDPDVDDSGQLDEQGGDQLADLEFGDNMSDTRDYECGNCGEPVEYLGGEDAEEGGKQCPACGERLFWSQL